MAIAAFDIIETDAMYCYLLGLDEEEIPDALNHQFEAVGFETIWFIHNLGSMGIIISLFPILAVFELLLRPFKNQKVLVKW